MSDQLPTSTTGWGSGLLSLVQSLVQSKAPIPAAVAKLIDTIGDPIGIYLKGKAEASAMVAEAKAIVEVATIELQGKLALKDIEDRREQRIRNREARRQKNLEAIAARAVRELPQSVSEKPVDEDWVAQFLNHCQEISNEQMQSLWARILAGEVAKPGSFSLRTLAVVRQMSKNDANLFTQYCSAVWQAGNELIPINPDVLRLRSDVETRSATVVPTNFWKFVRLESLGLVRQPLHRPTRFGFTEASVVLHYYGRRHALTSKKGRGGCYIGQVSLLTEEGEELFPIAGSSPNEEYRIRTVSLFRSLGWEVVED